MKVTISTAWMGCELRTRRYWPRNRRGKADEKRVVDPLLERGAAGDHAGRLNNGDGSADPGKVPLRVRVRFARTLRPPGQPEYLCDSRCFRRSPRLRREFGQEIEHFLAELGVDPLERASLELLCPHPRDAARDGYAFGDAAFDDARRSGSRRAARCPDADAGAAATRRHHLATRCATLAPVPFVHRSLRGLPFRDRIVRTLRRYNQW